EKGQEPFLYVDRITREEIKLSANDFDDLCRIHLYDWLEQVPRSKGWDYRRAAYRRMVGRLGPAAQEAYDRVFAGENGKHGLTELENTMKSLADRFRRWYEYERDCNAKSLAMLASVPEERRAAPEFQKAVDRMAHILAARQRWLNRLGHYPETPPVFPQGSTLSDLATQAAETEAAWIAYLGKLDERELA